MERVRRPVLLQNEEILRATELRTEDDDMGALIPVAGAFQWWLHTTMVLCAKLFGSWTRLIRLSCWHASNRDKSVLAGMIGRCFWWSMKF